MKPAFRNSRWVTLLLLFAFAACTGRNRDLRIYQNKGSDTLVNLAQGWAEEYRNKNSKVAFAVTGGGTGTGVAALINGTVDIANASRAIKPDEAAKAKANTGKMPYTNVVALDALAVFVHKNNPITQISLEELACIYGEGGMCENWSSVQNLVVPGCQGNTIIRISRQSNSGTYQYFRETVMGDKRDFKLGSRDMNGSKEAVDLIEKTPCAIAFSGMGYLSPLVKPLCISKKKGEPCVNPTPANAQDRSYPIARELYMYTLGEPTGDIKAYLDWIKGEEGQNLVLKMGYVPFKKAGR